MQIDVKRTVDDHYRSAINALLDRSFAADGVHPLSDHAWLDLVDGGRPGFAALVASLADHDHPVGYAQISRGAEGRNWSLDLVIDPHHRFDGSEIAHALLDSALGTIREQGGGHVHHWVSHPSAAHDRLAATHGMHRGRDLLQLRIALPLAERTELVTRTFRPGNDEAAWLAVNNRAFDWHPEQGNWTIETLQRREAEPWFDPAGFLLHERDGRLGGFCWTKIHHDVDPALGEIYVIAVDPDFAGIGLGRALTVAGLDSLSARGVRHGMLYVDQSNKAAVGLYERLGFRLDHVNRAYAIDV